jgi:hypothetical protein
MWLLQQWKLDVIRRLQLSSFNCFDQLRGDGFVPDDELRTFLDSLNKLGLIFYTGQFSVATTKKGNKIFSVFLLPALVKKKLLRAK